MLRPSGAHGFSPHDPARRHGRVLRGGRAARPARAARQARDRGRRPQGRTRAGRRVDRLLRGAPLRRGERDADLRGVPTLPARASTCSPTWSKLRARVRADHGDPASASPTCVEPVSIDEAFLDVTGSARALGDGRDDRPHLKQAIRDETQLTASVGVATSKLVAKVASDVRKPDGLVGGRPRAGSRVPGAAAGAAALGRGTQDGGDARQARSRHHRRAGRARPGAALAQDRDARPRPAAARAWRGRPRRGA